MLLIKLARIGLAILCSLSFLFIFSIDLVDYGGVDEEPVDTSDVLCIVLTTEKYLFTRAVAIWDTWGRNFTNILFVCNCTNVMAVKEMLKSNDDVPDELREYLAVQHLPVFHVNVNEKQNLMGRKVVAVLNETYGLFASRVKWYYMVDDDAFVFVENLVRFIRTKDTTKRHMYGFKRTGAPSGNFVYGGSGILFTNTSMRLLHEKIKMDGCKRHVHGYGDWTIGRCARALRITIGNSSDEYGRPRFHAYTPYTHYYGPLPSKIWRRGTHNRKIGKECCSLQSIAFHYVNTTLMYDMYRNKNFLKEFLK